ncbi:hypothetical protein MFLAVUS_001551 [Mucor flavus]|uniref:Tc1-like transposase DDE domain-containing protein n=1 Tax=Mucor flavus TaxID=439312 RepID=A0ABP9YMV3_9FUNG
MHHSRAWLRRGTQAIIESTSARGVSHTVIGAVSAFGVLNMSMRETGNFKKRRVVGATKRKAAGDVGAAISKGTTAGCYLRFISDTLDITDAFFNMKGFHIIMDNTPIHSPNAINYIIKERGYIPLYLPPYSPELNPIEIFWKVLKNRVKRGKISDVETLTAMAIEGSKDVPIEHLQNFIQHSIDIFPKCLNKKSL